MNDLDKIEREYTYRRFNMRSGDGPVIHTFTGTSKDAISEGKRLAKEKGYSVTMWTPAYGMGGSIRFDPWE